MVLLNTYHCSTSLQATSDFINYSSTIRAHTCYMHVYLQHPRHQVRDVLLTVTSLSTFIEPEALLWQPTLGRVQLEVGANSVDLVDKILKARDAILSELALDHRVI